MSFARIAVISTILTAMAISPASAQFTTQRPITQQEYYKLSVSYASNEATIRAVIDYLGGLPEGNQAVLVGFYQEILSDRAYSDYMHARFSLRFDPTMSAEDALAAGLLQGSEVVLDGVFRLSAERQEQYLAFARFGLEQVIATNPGLCFDLAAADVDALDYAAVDFTAMAAMSPADLEELLDLYREAIAAEIENRAPALVVNRDDRETGEAALSEATVALVLASPLGDRLEEVETLDDFTAEEICQLTLIVFDAFDQLPQPERSWALEAVLGQVL